MLASKAGKGRPLVSFAAFAMPPLANAAEYEREKRLSAAAPDRYWGEIAARSLHWFSDGVGSGGACWLTRIEHDEEWSGWWSGWSASDGESVRRSARAAWPVGGEPWDASMDAREAPFVRWFVGGRTSAAFNEVDRHMLNVELADAGDGGTVFFVEPDPQQAPNGAYPQHHTSLSQLMLQSTLAARAMHHNVGLASGARLGIYLPNGPWAVTWIEAAKRGAWPFCAVASGTASSALANRLADTAVDAFIFGGDDYSAALALAAVGECQPLEDLMVLVRCALNTDPLRLDEAPPPLPGFEDELPWQDANAMLGSAMRALYSQAKGLLGVCGVRELWGLFPPVAVEASHPLFVLYTSGSTGKPKGIVHGHGGYLTGLVASSKLGLGLQSRRDTMLVVATPGWITGQSYMIAAALLCRCPSVLLDGSPVTPPDRFAAVIARHRVSVLKAGSTFLRMLMTSTGAAPIARHDLSSLRLGTFCAEPVNLGVHQFAQEHLTANYINSYWATEHGGIVWGRSHEEQPLRPDTKTWPLPFISGAVLMQAAEDGGDGDWTMAAAGEQGDVVIRAQYPYMALTVWKSDGFGTPSWRGDLARWRKYFVAGVGYVQGDAAVMHEDGSYTFHGRSDEVINVGGNRIGTEEIETAILLDCQRTARSPVRNCAVVGAHDAMYGTRPYAFVVPQPGQRVSAMDIERLSALVLEQCSPPAVPARYVICPGGLPETYSGKIQRRVLRLMLEKQPVGSLSAMKNPGCVPQLLEAIEASNTLPSSQESVEDTTTDETTQPLPRTKEELLGGILSLVADCRKRAMPPSSLAGASSSTADEAASSIDADTPLMAAGITSRDAAALAIRLSSLTRLQVSPTVVRLIFCRNLPLLAPHAHVWRSCTPR